MGNKFVVSVWRYIGGDGDSYLIKNDHPNYEEFDYYRGESLLAALWNLFKAKREGYGYVKLEWRSVKELD